jgi:hypothetical protein
MHCTQHANEKNNKIIYIYDTLYNHKGETESNKAFATPNYTLLYTLGYV